MNFMMHLPALHLHIINATSESILDTSKVLINLNIQDYRTHVHQTNDTAFSATLYLDWDHFDKMHPICPLESVLPQPQLLPQSFPYRPEHNYQRGEGEIANGTESFEIQ